jgi:hypothetical protein
MKLLVLTLLTATFACSESGTLAPEPEDLMMLPCGRKFLDFGWKQNASGSSAHGVTYRGSRLWIATRPMRADEEPETVYLTESSGHTIVMRECPEAP